MSQPSTTTRGSCGLMAGRRMVPPPPGPDDAPGVLARRGPGHVGRARRRASEATSGSQPSVSCAELAFAAPDALRDRHRLPRLAQAGRRRPARGQVAQERLVLARRSRRGRTAPRRRASRRRRRARTRPPSKCCRRPGRVERRPTSGSAGRRCAPRGVQRSRAPPPTPAVGTEREVRGGAGGHHRVHEDVGDAGPELGPLAVARTAPSA